MDFNKVALFVSVIEAGSLSEAARRLHVAKSNLSRALAGLEKDLGVQLVYRNTRNFQPTEAGQIFYRQCKGPLFDLKIAGANLKKDEDELKGKFIITMAVDVALTLMPPLLADFAKSYPKLELDIRGEDRIVDLVKEGIDLALRMGPLADSNLRALKISDVTLILVSTPQYLAQNGRVRTTDQLIDHRMITFNKRYEKMLQMMKRNGRTQKIKITTAIAVNNPLIAKAMALNGQGIALLPDILCYEELRAGTLLRVLPEFATEAAPFHYVWPSHAAASPKVRAFIDFSKESLKKYFINAGV